MKRDARVRGAVLAGGRPHHKLSKEKDTVVGFKMDVRARALAEGKPEQCKDPEMQKLLNSSFPGVRKGAIWLQNAYIELEMLNKKWNISR